MSEQKIDNQSRELYRQYVESTEKKIVSNSENYDKTLISMSSIMLGLSLSFIKEIIPLHEATWLYILILSWILFGLCIGMTTLSFLFGQYALEDQIGYAERYYIGGIDEYLNKESKWGRWTRKLNLYSGISFISAFFLTIIFVILNIGDKILAEKMLQNNKLEKGLHTSVMVERGTNTNDGIYSGRMVPNSSSNTPPPNSSTQTQIPNANTNNSSNASQK